MTNLLPRKTWRQRILKGVHVFALTALVVNMTAVSVFIQPSVAEAATSGPNSADAFVNDATVGTISWNSVNNASSSNNSNTVADLDDNQVSRYLKVTDFDFAIPAGATINGILVEVEQDAENADRIKDNSVRIVKGGTIGTQEKANANFWGTSDTYVSYGSVSDLWGTTWTPAEINAADFGVVISATKASTSGGAVEARIDHVRITVDYTEAAAPTNPPLGQSCGLDIGLIIDSSGSIDSTELGQMKTAMTSFVNAFLPGTPTLFSVNEFDTNVVDPTLAFTGTAATINARINAASSGGFTNWEAPLLDMHNQYDPRDSKPDLIVFASDGNPNTVGTSGISSGGGATEAAAVAAAVTRANAIKADGIRIIALGIGNDLDVNNLKAISGPNVATTAAQISATSDVITADFATLATTLSNLANELCGGKILVQKQFDTDGDGNVDIDGSQSNAALNGWTFDVNGTVTNPAPATTTNTGALSFDVENGTYSVTETNQKAGTHIVSASCVNGTQPVGTFNLGTKTVSGLVMATDQTITCTFLNGADTASLRVNKNVDTDGDGDIDITGATDWTWDIQGGEQNIATGSTRTLLTGAYTISEDQKSGYHVTNLTCDNTNHGAVASKQITLGTGLTTCTFTNTRDTGTVTFQKVIVGGPQNHVPADWTFTVNNQQVNGNGGSTTLLTNTNYTVTETSSYSDLYTLTNATGVCSINGQGQIIVNTTAQGGTCTVTNTRNTGSLVVHKDVVNPDGGAVANTHQFTITLDGGNAKTIAEGADATYLNLPTGTYTIVEAPDANYTFVSYSSDADANTAGAQVVVTKNATTQLTVTNKQKKATITLNKDVRDYLGNNVADNTSFQVTWSGSPITISENTPAVLSVNPGVYTFTETANPLYTTQTTSYQVTVTSNGSETRTFVNWQKPGTISGVKFNDVNGNGIKDGGDNGLQNWEIYLDANNSGTWTAGEVKVTTDANGNYSFTNLTPGNYKVREVQKAGWMQTAPASNLHNIDLTVGQTVANKDFGNFQLGSIAGTKYNDLDGDGNKDAGEPGLAGWTINIAGPINASVVTDSNGNYTFTGLTAGNYTVSETQQAGWTQTAPGGATHAVVITSGTASTGKDFGNFQLISVRVCKYIDVNGDGVIANDPFYLGQGGWAMTVNQITQNTVEGCTTFSNLGPGAYTVSEGAKAGWTKTVPQAANYQFTAVSGQNQTFSFGNYQTATVSGYKFEDVNGNGTWDNGELGLANWGITATKNQVVKNATTDANGFYQFSFSASETGSWTISETQQTGWTQTAPANSTYVVDVTSGTSEMNKNFGNFENASIYVCKYVDENGDGLGSNDDFYFGQGGWPITVNGVTKNTVNGCVAFDDLGPGQYTISEGSRGGWIQTFPTGNGTHQLTAQSGMDYEFNFRNFELGSVAGNKFEDMNGNGQYDDGVDTAKSGVTIKLWKNGSVVGTDVTDVNGAYSFTGLTAGDYTLSENPLAGWIQTYPPLPGTYNFSITSGDHLTGYDFGNFKQTSISGMKFDDVNGNGQKDQGEDGLAGWTINLSGPINTSTITDGSGNYSFDALIPGTYSVSETNQAGWVQTYPASGTHADITLVSGTPVAGKDFGNFKLGTVSGYKYDNANEDRLDGWEICISGGSIDLDVRQLVDFGVDCVTTGAGEWPTGYYEFSDLFAGTYTLTETLQDGWEPVDPASGEQTVEITSQFGGERNFWNRRIYPDLTITKTDGLETANPGQTITYTIVVKNEGEYKADDVVVTDTLPAHLTFVSANPAVATQVGNILTWNLGTMNVDAEQVITVNASIDAVMPFGTTEIVNTATVTTTTDEPNTENNSATDTTSVSAAPTIALTKTASSATVNAGGEVTFTMNWSVGGNSQVTNLVLTDVVPANTTFVSANNGGTYVSGTNTVTWNLGTKNPSDNGSVTMTVRVFSPLANGTVITNTATLDSTENSLVQAAASVTVVSAPILNITKTVNKAQVNPGTTVTYTVTVSNTGNDQAINVVLTDTLPTGFTFVDGGTSTKTFNLGTIAAGASVTTTYVVNVAADTTAGVKENIAKAKADNHTEVSARVPVEVIIPQVLSDTSAPVLKITKTVSVTFANPGNTVTYTVVVENTGDAVAVNVQLQDLLPAGFTFLDGQTTRTFGLGDLNPGEKRQIEYDVLVNKTITAGTYENLAVTWADNHPNVTTKAPLEIRVPKVLGEALPVTGNRVIEYGLMAVAVLTVLFVAWTLWVTRREETGEQA